MNRWKTTEVPCRCFFNPMNLKSILTLVTCLSVPSAFAAEPNPLTAPLAAEHPLYLKTDAPLDQRVADLVSRMTLEEKAMALDHDGPDLARFGLRSDKWNQCLHGVGWTEPTTMFPVPIAMAATWDPALVHDVAAAISDEARAIYNGWHQDPNFQGEHKGLIYRAPVINISRNPYWGRIDECCGEDPFLTGRMGVAFVKGMQGDDPRYLKLAATLKHFAVNNVEKRPPKTRRARSRANASRILAAALARCSGGRRGEFADGRPTTPSMGSQQRQPLAAH